MFTPVIFFFAFLARLVFIPFPGFKADIAYWKWWGMSAAHDGLSGPLVNTAYNYPSFYLYILKITSHLYEIISGYNFKLDPHNLNFWSDTNLLYLFLIKFPYILADLAIGVLIYKIVNSLTPGESLRATPGVARQKSAGDGASLVRVFLSSKKLLARRAPAGPALIAASLYLFNPVVIYNSVIWGQTDSIGSFFVLLAFYFLLTSRYSLLSAASAIALFMKTQTLVFLPLLFLGVFLKAGKPAWQGFIKSLLVFTATVIIINLPFLLSHTMDRVFDIMYSSQLYFPYVSMNAYNLWWLFFGRISSSFWDQRLIAGLITYKTAGVVLFGAVYALALILIKKALQKKFIPEPAIITGKLLTSAFVLVSLAFFMLLTQMHERYLFPLFVFFPLLLGFWPRTHKSYLPVRRSFGEGGVLLTSYFLLSVTTLLNLHQIMIMNYPDNALPFLPNVFSEPLARIISLINLIILITLIIFLTIEISRKIKLFIFLGTLFLLAISSLPQISKTIPEQISITKLKPLSIHQDFGRLQSNKNLSNNWLASNYYYTYHGLATHANSNIIYDLGGRYKTFTTNFGIDNDANTNASVHFKILGDSRELFVSPLVGRFTYPGFTKVDISGVKKLELVVDDAGDGINSDHADWLEPMLYK